MVQPGEQRQSPLVSCLARVVSTWSILSDHCVKVTCNMHPLIVCRTGLYIPLPSGYPKSFGQCDRYIIRSCSDVGTRSCSTQSICNFHINTPSLSNWFCKFRCPTGFVSFMLVGLLLVPQWTASALSNLPSLILVSAVLPLTRLPSSVSGCVVLSSPYSWVEGVWSLS